MVRAFSKTTQKPRHGSEKRPSKETPMPKLNWGRYTLQVKVFPKTTQKPRYGSKKRLNKGV